jgi:hypothetical protein
MTTTAPLNPDPLDVLRNLDAASIRSRMQQLDAEREGLRVLLRAAAARERALARQQAAQRKGGGDG